MIKNIIEQIREQQIVAKKEIVPDGRTMASQLGNIKRAEENLSSLFVDLRNEVSRNAIIILVKGSGSKKFGKIADEAFGCLSFEADSLFKKIASRVDDSYLQKTASPGIFDIAMGAMSDLAHEVGILNYNHLQFTNDDATHLKDRKDLEKLIANAFNRDIGAELVVLNAIQESTLKIMESDFEGTKVPLILHSSDPQLIDKIALDAKNLNSNVFVVNSVGKVDEGTVEKQLTQINEKVKKGQL